VFSLQKLQTMLYSKAQRKQPELSCANTYAAIHLVDKGRTVGDGQCVIRQMRVYMSPVKEK